MIKRQSNELKYQRKEESFSCLTIKNTGQISPVKTSQLIYDNQIQEKRKQIYLEKNLSIKISLCYELIVSNKQFLNSLIEEGKIQKNSINSIAFHFFLDYFYNFILLFNLCFSQQNKSACFQILEHLHTERTETYNIDKYIETLLSIPKKHFSNDIFDYIQLISCILQCTRQYQKNYLYERVLLEYIKFIEQLPDNRMYISYLYFYYGEILCELDYLSCAKISYELSYRNLSEYARSLHATNCLVSSLFNQALISFTKGENIPQVVLILNEAKKLKQRQIGSYNKNQQRYSKLTEEECEANLYKDKQLNQIYLSLAEIDYNNSTIDKMHEYISYLENCSFNLSEEDKIKVNYIFDKMNSTLDNSNTPNDNNIINNDDFINFCINKGKRQSSSLSSSFKDIDVEELQKLFHFLSSLSSSQIELLNKEQPSSNNVKKFKSLPIYFSNVFKQSLTYEQHLMLNEIKILNLKRGSILKNLTGKISIENLELNILHQFVNKKSLALFPLISMTNIQKVSANLNQYEKFQLSNMAREAKKNLGFTQSDTVSDFKYQQKLPYETIKTSLKKYLTASGLNAKQKEAFQDSLVIKILNKLSLKEVKFLNENPQWLVEMLEEFDEDKVENKESSIVDKNEVQESEKIEEDVNDKEEESYFEEIEQNQNKSID